MTRRTARLGLAGLLLLAACSSERDGDASGRGAGLQLATLSAAERASAYATALRAAFQIEPNLVLLLDPTILPGGGEGREARELPADVVRRLRATGTIRGTCRPAPHEAKVPPVCTAEKAGYVIRLSHIFREAGDSVQLYLTGERYRPARDTAGYQSPLHFEQRHHLARRKGGWVVSKQERLVS